MGEKQAHRICKSIQTAELDCYASKTATCILFIEEQAKSARKNIGTKWSDQNRYCENRTVWQAQPIRIWD